MERTASGRDHDERTRPAVVKVGGNNLREEKDLLALRALLLAVGSEAGGVAVVHGGSPELEALSGAIGPRGEIAGGPWGEVEASVMVLCGLLNKRLVASLTLGGLAALGLSGLDCGMLKASFLNLERLGRVGGPPRVSASMMARFLDSRFIPVIAPICQGPDGGPVRVASDTVAHALAAALGAGKLIFVCDAPGVEDSQGSVVRRLSKARAHQMLHGAQVTAELIPKIHAALAALASGVGRVLIGDLEKLSAGAATEVTA